MAKKILVVDDEPDFLEIIKTMLEADDYEVITALDGKEALNKIKRQKPDLVLLDILMPGLDGFETLRRIRKQNKKLPVFFITAFSDKERFKLAKELNSSGLILKTSDLKKEFENITSFLEVAGRYGAKK